LLNIGLILALFCPYGITFEAAVPLAVCYIVTVLISLSPIGEWTLAALAGAKEIKRKDIKIRLIPLLEIVFEQVKARTPYMVNSIRLKIIHDQSPNAFAIGRRTICVTDGLLNLSDEEIMAVFAHEVGHLAYQHSAIQLLIGGGNLFISGFLLIIKIVCWIITGIFALVGISTRSFWGGFFMTLFGSLSAVLIWLWTKFCMLFLMWSVRQNEFVADEYAYKLGYGAILASVLDRHMCSTPENGLLKALYSTHPHSDDRVARLQDLGANYSRY
jgi:heat shock protein HtpX